jgi:hypothetical protein
VAVVSLSLSSRLRVTPCIVRVAMGRLHEGSVDILASVS